MPHLKFSVSLLLGLSLVKPALSAAQAAVKNVALEPANASVALLTVAMYNAQANQQEATDSARGTLATAVLDSTLRQLMGTQILAATSIATAGASSEAVASSGGLPCNVRVACARMVARSVKAPWVVMAKVSKTSNLIWLLTGQLIHVPTGEVILDDSTELKGDPGQMIRVGTRIFAERVSRTVRAGGVTTNFPNPW